MRKLQFQKFIFAFVCCLIFCCNPLFAHSRESLVGPTFISPSSVAQVPQGWEQKTINRAKSGQYDLVIALDQHLYPALLPVINDYGRENNIRIQVQEGTCGISAGSLYAKTADIAGFCCPPSKGDRLPGLRYHTLGISALAILVHFENPVVSIPLEQVREIFRGTIKKWSGLDSAGSRALPNLNIRPVGRLHCKDRPGHWRLLLDNEDLFSPLMHEVGSIKDMIIHVARHRWSIGYEVLWNIERYQEEGAVKYVSIDNLSPEDPGPLASGRYPLFRVYNITTWEAENTENPIASKLATYIMKHGGANLSKYGIMPASVLKDSGWKFSGDELIGKP